MSQDEMHSLLSEIDVAYNGQMELQDYLQVNHQTYIFNIHSFSSQLFGDKEVPGEELHEILREIDTNMNGQVELDEYLQVCDIAHCAHSHSRIYFLTLLFPFVMCPCAVRLYNGFS